MQPTSGRAPDAPGAADRARIAGLVRLARRAGRVEIGVRLTRDAVRRGRATTILLADDLSGPRRDRLIDRWRRSGVPIMGGWTKDELGELAGRAAVAALTITDPDIAAGIAALGTNGFETMQHQGEE